MTCDKCPEPAIVFIGIGSTGQRLCQQHYDEYKAAGTE